MRSNKMEQAIATYNHIKPLNINHFPSIPFSPNLENQKNGSFSGNESYIFQFPKFGVKGRETKENLTELPSLSFLLCNCNPNEGKTSPISPLFLSLPSHQSKHTIRKFKAKRCFTSVFIPNPSDKAAAIINMIRVKSCHASQRNIYKTA